MKTYLALSAVLVLSAVPAYSQTGPTAGPVTSVKTSASAVRSAAELAQAAFAAHGGEKLKKMRSLVMKGSVDLNVFNQSMPGAFSTAISGDKYFFEIVSPMQSLKQVYNGRDTFSSLQGFSLPPVTSLGFPLLPRVGDEGYTVTAHADAKKKGKAFRITTPEGFYTDFTVDEKTGRLKGYESSYDVGGRIVTTSVQIDEFQTVDGILVPKRYSQRFDLGQMTAYANFKSKDILVNSKIEDNAFDLK